MVKYVQLSLSVVIPVYNSEKTLERCLGAIINSITPFDEVIVINDGSLDRSEKIAKQYNLKLINLTKNSGAANARNIGANVSTKDIILFVDSDIIISKEMIVDVKEYFTKHKDVHTITVGVNSEIQDANYLTNFKNVYMDYITSDSSESVNYVYGSFCATRRSIFFPWPVAVRLIEDSVWGYQQEQAGLKVHIFKKVRPMHLKRYNLKTLLVNDFLVSSLFARSFFENSRWKTLVTGEKFGHTSKIQKLSVILAIVTTFAFFLNYHAGLILYCAWGGLNYKFFIFIYKKRNFLFFIKSLVWYFIDCNVYFLGIFHGFLMSLKLRIRETA